MAFILKDPTYDSVLLRDACLTCPRENCSGDCALVSAEHAQTDKIYEYGGRMFSTAELCLLSGRTKDSLKNAIRDKREIKHIFEPNPGRFKGWAIEYRGIKNSIENWARVCGVSKKTIYKRMSAKYTSLHRSTEYIREYADALKAGLPDNENVKRAELVYRGRLGPYSNMYDVFHIIADTDEVSEEDVLEWASVHLYPGRLPQMFEWHDTVMNRDASLPMAYYYNGFHILSKEKFGYKYTVAKPCAD